MNQCKELPDITKYNCIQYLIQIQCLSQFGNNLMKQFRTKNNKNQLQCIHFQLANFIVMSIENLQSDKNPQSTLQSNFNQFQLTQPQQLAQNTMQLHQDGQKQSSIQQLPTTQAPTIDYRYPQFIQYFKSKEIFGQKWKEMSSILLHVTQFQVNSQITSGFLKISNQTKEVGKGVASPTLPDKTKTVKEILSKKSNLEQQLKSIQQELQKIGENKDQKEQKKDQISQVQHKKFIQRMMKIRKATENKRKLMLQYEKEKVLKEIKKQQQERKLSQQKIKQQRQKSIKQKLEEKQKQRLIQLQQQKESLKKYKQVLERKRIHQIMKEKYESSIMLPMLQQQRQILKERSSRFKGYSIEQIRNFEKEYDRSKQQKMSQLSNGSKSTWQYKPPSFSPKILKILQQEKMKQKIRLEQQKRALQQKIERKSNYAQYVKETISVKIDQKKKLQLLLLNKSKVSKQKSYQQLHNIGNKYMREGRNVKSELRKGNFSVREQKTEVSKDERKKSNTTLNHNEHEKFIREAHKERINKIISSNDIQKVEKIQKLKVEANKLSERIKRKEQIKKVKPLNKETQDNIQQLLTSIKAKVGMVDLLKN